MFSGDFCAFHRGEAAYKAATCVMLPRSSREQRVAFTVSCYTKINGTPMLTQDCPSISAISAAHLRRQPFRGNLRLFCKQLHERASIVAASCIGNATLVAL